MFFFKRKYDLIFGIGEACSCSSTLRRANLQIQSFPFDWIFGGTFLERVDILVNNFENFIKYEDLEYLGDNGIPSHLCNIYKNNYNNLIFKHDFLAEDNIEKTIFDVQQKYERRAKRQLSLAEKAERILVIWIDSPGHLWKEKNNQDFINGFNKIQNKFSNAQIDMLVFAWQKNLKFQNRKKEEISNNILKYTFDYQFHHKKKIVADYVVDEKMLLKILRKYELKMSFKEKFENFKLKKLNR